ncbi:hypothetical protein B0H14DRAFT_3460880 [Mycena olivaceomarginata]|nr:hypothetical protein B0H14DRAFT_3460880 [Mycena olivaceomarginata]
MEISERSEAVILGFVDLPTELLLMIFDFLHDELFCLSLLCRGLHFLALPIFLERNSIVNPCETTLVDFGMMRSPSDTVLRALTVALFVPSIKQLTCVFPSTYTFRRVDNIWRVTRLMRRMTTVENLSLEFIPSMSSSESAALGRGAADTPSVA